ncbi:hypothetical protein Tco_0420893 [Tanacetum coccineum]
MAAFKVLKTQFQMFIKSRMYIDDEYVVMTHNYFLQYTQLEIPELHDTLIQHIESVKKSIDERAKHKQEYNSWVNERQMLTTEDKVDSSKALDASLPPKLTSITIFKLSHTPYLPKERNPAIAKPHHMIAPGSSRYSSNDMVHKHYLEEAKKKTQESSRNSEPSVMPSARSQSTTNGSKPKPRINNQKSRNWHASKSSCVHISECAHTDTL